MSDRATKNAVQTANPPSPQADDAEVGELWLEEHVEHDQIEQAELDPAGEREAVDVRLRLCVAAGQHRLLRTALSEPKNVIAVPNAIAYIVSAAITH